MSLAGELGPQFVEGNRTAMVDIVPECHRLGHAQEVHCTADQDTDVENLV